MIYFHKPKFYVFAAGLARLLDSLAIVLSLSTVTTTLEMNYLTWETKRNFKKNIVEALNTETL